MTCFIPDIIMETVSKVVLKMISIENFTNVSLVNSSVHINFEIAINLLITKYRTYYL